MIDTYILLNRKPKIISKIFIYNVLFLLFLVIYIIFNINYTTYFISNSIVIFNDNSYLLEINVSMDELSYISSKNVIIINGREYVYQIDSISSEVTLNNDIKYQKVYLKVFNLDKIYQIDNYSVDVKIQKERKKIIYYLINKKEE